MDALLSVAGGMMPSSSFVLLKGWFLQTSSGRAFLMGCSCVVFISILELSGPSTYCFNSHRQYRILGLLASDQVKNAAPAIVAGGDRRCLAANIPDTYQNTTPAEPLDQRHSSRWCGAPCSCRLPLTTEECR